MNYRYFLAIVFMATIFSCNQEEKSPQTLEKTIPNVEVEKVSAYTGLQSLQYSGLVEAKQVTPLSFKTPGTIVDILVEEGQYVKKGQLLAKLDDTDAQNSYALSSQQLMQAQDAYDRMKPMHINGTLPEIKWVEIETGLSQAKITSEMAKKRIDDTALYAPKSGVIGSKNIQLGMNIMPSVSAFDLMDINTVYVNIPVPENEVGSLKKGQSAEINIAAINEVKTGNIHLIGVSANTLTHAYPVKLLVDNKDWKLKPGMVCNVKIASNSTVEGAAVSNKALQRNAHGQQFVYVVHNNKVTAQPVRTIDLVDNQVIISDLTASDYVVVSGQHKLSEGSEVNILNTVN
ncbi:efflux RND transporter periplasmic adaptor subunit [Membranihabitans marinus]|uniref:efflux RND transporter periplasmic adaptor subunit n=1 Tax=Membranihabitans marinus TaxID=1227546 RepID=UPI001F0019D9|nr:efflux RND transporter periplasmic adaptor subunit [Membranihabitans marinus]